MNPPPNPRMRRMTGEEITPDQIKYTGGLGLREAMDRQQYMQYRGGYSGTASSSDIQLDLPGPFPARSNPTYNYSSASQYMPTPHAGVTPSSQGDYNTGMPQYSRASSLASSYAPPLSNIQDRPFSVGHNSAYPPMNSMDRQYPVNNSNGLSSMYGNGYGQTTARQTNDESPSNRSLLLSQPPSNSSQIPGWPSMPLQVPQRSNTMPLEQYQ